MADDAEAAFLSSMQAMNEVAGNYEATGAASEQHAESLSSDEYDPAPAHAVQAVSSLPDSSEPSNETISLVAVNHHPLLQNTSPEQIILTSDSKPATPVIDDVPASNTQSQLMPISRASTNHEATPETLQPVDIPKQNEQQQGGTIAQVSVHGDLGMNGNIVDSAFHSLSNTSLNHVSTDVSNQSDMQHRALSGVVQNGVARTVPNLAAVLPDTGAASHRLPTAVPAQTLLAPNVIDAGPDPSPAEAIVTPISAAPRARLPHDRIGILEDRIKEDPKGDLDAWLSLISEHRKRGKLEDARNVYERFFVVFPSAAEQWVAYAQMQNEAQNKNALEMIFNRILMQIPNIQLWSMYLDHIRRHNNITTDASGEARQIVYRALDLALQQIGLDKDSGRIWQDYVQFIKSGPGNIGGSNWQDQQKMDLLRKTYQRAICIPTQSTNTLWKEYDGFEMGLNKMTGRKFLQDQSPAYMSARSSYIELQNLTRMLRRTSVPVLPPAFGFDGDVEYMEQLEIWKRWIQWEKDDPLVLKQDDVTAYRARVVFLYKQALMAMRFWPEMWFDAADFCFLSGLEAEGNEFLTQGIAANPESCLLAFKHADRLELTTANEEGDESAHRRGAIVRECYDKVLDALYDLIARAKAREAQEIARVEARFATDDTQNSNGTEGNNNDDEMNEEESENKEKRKAEQIEAVKKLNAVQTHLLSKTISYVWIALMRAIRRIQGKGDKGKGEQGKKIVLGGSRQIFHDARRRGRITSDVYVASAMIEFHCYEPEAGKRIFERGLKLFVEDEGFALEYIMHLIAINDHTNARVVFETAVSRLAQKPETVARTKPLYAFFHDFESRYGELTQIAKLEKRMSNLFPEDRRLSLFSHRFAQQGFDPTAIRPIVSPATQARPTALPSIEGPPMSQETPPNRFVPTTNSPKRPLPLEESDTEAGRPRKLARGESPLKGAAGRRLDQQKRNRQPHEVPLYENHALPQALPPPLLPRDVLFLLSIIPKPETYHATKFKAEEMVRLIRETNIPTSTAQLRPPPVAMGIQAMQGIHGTPQMPQMPQMSQMSQMQQMPPQISHISQTPQGQYNGGYPMFSTLPGPTPPAQPNPDLFQYGAKYDEARNGHVMGHSAGSTLRWHHHNGEPLRSGPNNQGTAPGSPLSSGTPFGSTAFVVTPSGSVATRIASLSAELHRNTYQNGH